MGYTGPSGGWEEVYRELDVETGIEGPKVPKKSREDTEKKTVAEIFDFVEEEKETSGEAFEEKLLETQLEVEREHHEEGNTVIYYIDFEEQEIIPAVIDHWKDKNVYASLEWSERIEKKGEMDNLIPYLEQLSDAIKNPEGLMWGINFGIPEGLKNYAENKVAPEDHQDIAEYAAKADETSIPYIFPATSPEEYAEELSD